jgi:hypothetical protein
MRVDFIFECRLSFGEAILLQHVIARSRTPATKQSYITCLQRGDCFGLRPRNDGMDLMQIGETIYVTTGDEFREWLIQNYQTKKEIWLIQYKKATKKPSINYVDAVEEAICFGWIDGLEKSIDVERYAIRFSPRRPKSNWTETNKKRARKLIAEGRMIEAGRATLPPDVK